MSGTIKNTQQGLLKRQQRWFSLSLNTLCYQQSWLQARFVALLLG